MNTLKTSPPSSQNTSIKHLNKMHNPAIPNKDPTQTPVKGRGSCTCAKTGMGNHT